MIDCIINYDCGDRANKCKRCGWNIEEEARRKARLHNGGLVYEQVRGVRRLIVRKPASSMSGTTAQEESAGWRG